MRDWKCPGVKCRSDKAPPSHVYPPPLPPSSVLEYIPTPTPTYIEFCIEFCIVPFWVMP